MKNLVIIPTGKNSEHQKWDEFHKNHGFDLCLLNYSGLEQFNDRNSIEAKYIVNKAGMKFKLLTHFLQNNSTVVDEYDRFFLMDDDIITSPSNIEKFLTICEEEDFDLAQPALNEGSTYTFVPTLKIKNAKYHLTNMVEIMMPCFSKRLFKETLEDIKNSKYGHGWGLEGVWNKKFHVGKGFTKFGGKIGVIDDVCFSHLRPLGGGDTKIYEKFGSPWEELREQETRVGFVWANTNFITHSITWKED